MTHSPPARRPHWSPWQHRGRDPIVDITAGWDATHEHLHAAPTGQGAGYTTGSSAVRWTKADWAAHPGAVRICQDASGTDSTADVVDDEPGADSDSGSVGWFKRALADYRAKTRPEQRYPCFYSDQDRLSGLEDAVTAAQLGDHIPLHLADWSLSMDEARQLLGHLRGPFIIVAVQFANRGLYDSDLWLTSWLNQTAAMTPQPVTVTTAPTTEMIMEQLPTLKQGDTGPAVRTLQGLLVARYYHLGTTGKQMDGIDGDYGTLTDAAVRDLQGKSSLVVDGICGPQTWPAAAGI